jgi:hypothetical protein
MDVQAEAQKCGANVIVGIKEPIRMELPKTGRLPFDDSTKIVWDDIGKKIPPPFPPDKRGGAAVGTNWDDVGKKFPPPFPPGGGGAAVAPMSIQPAVKQNWDWGKQYSPSYPKDSPGGISTEELASSFVDKGNWPVLTSFGLLYQTNTVTEKEQDKSK